MLEKLLKKLPWELGRQGTGYNKIKLFESKFFKADCYLLYYPKGSEIPVHRDPVSIGDHYRLNIMLKKAKDGGDFICKDPILRWPRVFYFRPDKSWHAVTRINEGYRLMLSIGWLKC